MQTLDQFLWKAQYFYAVSLIGFGIMQFATRNMVPGRVPPWNYNIETLAYIGGVIHLAAAFAIILRKQARLAAAAIGIVMIIGPVFRDIPLILASENFGGYWTNFFKYLALAGTAFTIASSFSQNSTSTQKSLNFTDLYGRISLAAFFIVCGIQHFRFPEFVRTLVPRWIPGDLFWTYFAAVALIAGGIGLLIKQTTYLAAFWSGVMIFIWFLILHIPRAITMNIPGEWFGVIETIAFSASLFVIALLKKPDRLHAASAPQSI